MMNNSIQLHQRIMPTILLGLSILIGLMVPSSVFAVDTLSLAKKPLKDSSTVTVLPNLMFVLDDSGSMDWNFTPDSACSLRWPNKHNAAFNQQYYNPGIRYTPALNYDGKSMPSFGPGTWTKVPTDIFRPTSSATVNLLTIPWGDLQAHPNCLMSYVGPNKNGPMYNATGIALPIEIWSGKDYPLPGTTTKAVARTDCVAKADVCTYEEEMTNFANWYVYYRTRMLSMKTSGALVAA